MLEKVVNGHNKQYNNNKRTEIRRKKGHTCKKFEVNAQNHSIRHMEYIDKYCAQSFGSGEMKMKLGFQVSFSFEEVENLSC